MKLEYYNELKNHIKTNVPEMRFVGFFNDQFNKENLEQSIDDPCCLIKMQPQNFRDTGAGLGIQEYDILLTLYIGYSNFKDQGEDILDFAEKINKAVHRFVPSLSVADMGYIGKAMRTDERPNYDHDQRIVYEIDYLVHFKDYTADNRRTKEVTLTENISVTYTQP